MPLCYAMQCYALQGAVPELSFLAKLYQPYGHDDQMVWVDSFEGDKSYNPTNHGHPWHGLDHGPAYYYDHNHNHGPDSHGLSNHDLNLGPWHFMHMGYSSIT